MSTTVDQTIETIDRALNPDTRIAEAVANTLPHSGGRTPSMCWRCSHETELRPSSWLCFGCALYLSEETEHDPKTTPPAPWMPRSSTEREIFALQPYYIVFQDGPSLTEFRQCTREFYRVASEIGARGVHSLSLDELHDPNNLLGAPIGHTLRLSTYYNEREVVRMQFIQRGDNIEYARIARLMMEDLASEIHPLPECPATTSLNEE